MLGVLSGLVARRSRRGASDEPFAIPVTVRARPPEPIPFPSLVTASVGRRVSVGGGVSWGDGAAWDLQGDLPEGLTFDRGTGRIEGVPTRPGTAEGLVLRSYGPAGRMGAAPFRIAVAA